MNFGFFSGNEKVVDSNFVIETKGRLNSTYVK